MHPERADQPAAVASREGIAPTACTRPASKDRTEGSSRPAIKGAVSSRIACVLGESDMLISRVLSAQAPEETPRRCHVERNNHAATVNVQRESTMSSTSNTGPAGSGLRADRQGTIDVARLLSAVGHGLLFRPIVRLLQHRVETAGSKPRPAAGRNPAPDRDVAATECRSPRSARAAGSILAPERTQASTKFIGKAPVTVLALPHQDRPIRHRPRRRAPCPAAPEVRREFAR